MSDIHPNGGQPATRAAETAPITAASFEPAEKRPSRSLIWIVGFGGVAVIVAAAVLYGYVTETPALARRNVAAAAQGRARSLGEKAAASRLAADQSASQSRALEVVAVKDRAAASRADVNATDAAAAASR